MSYLPEIDISRQIQIAHIFKNLVLFLNQLVVHEPAERIAKAVVFSVVYDERHAIAELDEVADVFCQRYGFWTDLDLVAGT